MGQNWLQWQEEGKGVQPRQGDQEVGISGAVIG